MAEEKNPKDSIFRRLGGSMASAVENILFSHEDVSEEQTAESTEADASQSSDQPQVRQTVIQRPAQGIGSTSKVDENLVNAIMQSAQELGKALTEFESYVKTFDGIIADEASRYKAAFAAAKKASPLTVKELLAAADEQIASLQTEKADFLEGIKAKNDEVEQLKVEMTHIDEKIVDLKRQIQDLENSKQTKTDLAKKTTENIQKASEKFELALAKVDEMLKAKKSKLLTYLKNM
jgi:chromosome segregation ATPase